MLDGVVDANVIKLTAYLLFIFFCISSVSSLIFLVIFKLISLIEAPNKVNSNLIVIFSAVYAVLFFSGDLIKLPNSDYWIINLLIILVPPICLSMIILGAARKKGDSHD